LHGCSLPCIHWYVIHGRTYQIAKRIEEIGYYHLLP
jgi:hypothetical protein